MCKKILVLLLIMAAAAAFCADRIATVDMEKIFRGYYKSRIAEDAIKQQAESYRSYLLKLNEELNALRRKAGDASANALNIALSAQEQQKAKDEAAEIKRKFNEKEAEIKLYIQNRTADMRDLESRKRKEILDDIRREINRRAAAEGYDFVLDVSGRTTNEFSAVIVSPAARDISDAVIKELNRTGTSAAKSAK